MFESSWRWGFVVLWGLNPAWALELSDNPLDQSTLPKPLVLTSKEKIKDSLRFPLPDPPKRYFDESQLSLVDEKNSPPEGPPLLNLDDPSTLQEIPKVNKRDHSTGKYYWHPYKGWNYCHLRQGRRHWYGWRTGGTFHWVLWNGTHFWWRDEQAGRWLYFDRGYWWWQGVLGKAHGLQFQVLLSDGRYHDCGLDGKLEDPVQ